MFNRKNQTAARDVLFAISAASFGLLLGAGLGMSGVVNILTAIECLYGAAIFLVIMLWTYGSLSWISTLWLNIIRCVGSLLILMGLLVVVRFVQISEINRQNQEEQKQRAMIANIVGGSGYVSFDAIYLPSNNQHNPWILEVLGADDVPLKNVTATIWKVNVPDGTANDMFRVLYSVPNIKPIRKFDLGTIAPGFSRIKDRIATGIYFIDVQTAAGRFIERLNLRFDETGQPCADSTLFKYGQNNYFLKYVCSQARVPVLDK